MRPLIVLIALIANCLLGFSPAQAASEVVCEPGQTPVLDGDTILFCIGEPGTGGGKGGNGGGGGGCPDAPGGNCTGPGGSIWFGAPHSCYASQTTDPEFINNPNNAYIPPKPKEGEWTLWGCITGGEEMMWWVRSGQPPVDASALAQQAFGQMQLPTAQISTAPKPPNQSYVGLDTWLWIPDGQWQTLTGTAATGGARVTVTAAPLRTYWQMGDGNTTTCPGPGREWVFFQMRESDTTDCSYRYQTVSDFQADDLFHITARVVFAVDWTCTGNCDEFSGTLGDVGAPDGASAIRVGERQSVVVR